MPSKDVLSRDALEKVVALVAEASAKCDDINQLEGILSGLDPEIIGDSLQYATEEYRDALTDLRGQFGWQAIFRPKQSLETIAKAIEKFSEIYVESARLVKYFFLQELLSIAGQAPPEIRDRWRALVRDTLSFTGESYRLDEAGGTFICERTGADVLKDPSPFHATPLEAQTPQGRFSSLMGRVRHLTEVLAILEAATTQELVDSVESTIPVTSLRLSFEAFRAANEQIGMMRKEYCMLLEELGGSPGESRALSALDHSRVPLMVRFLQNYRDLVISYSPQSKAVEGGLIGWSLVSSALNIGSPALGISLALLELFATSVGESLAGGVRNKPAPFDEKDAIVRAAYGGKPMSVAFTDIDTEPLDGIGKFFFDITLSPSRYVEGLGEVLSGRIHSNIGFDFYRLIEPNGSRAIIAFARDGSNDFYQHTEGCRDSLERSWKGRPLGVLLMDYDISYGPGLRGEATTRVVVPEFTMKSLTKVTKRDYETYPQLANRLRSLAGFIGRSTNGGVPALYKRAANLMLDADTGEPKMLCPQLEYPEGFWERLGYREIPKANLLFMAEKRASWNPQRSWSWYCRNYKR